MVQAGQRYRNPYDGDCGPIISIVHVDGEEAVCTWRYANSPKNRLNTLSKPTAEIERDWNQI